MFDNLIALTTILFYTVLSIYFTIGFTWFFYLAAMHLKHNKEKISPIEKVFGYPWIFFAYAIDVMFNFIVGTILFLEIPREFIFTDRVSRHIKKSGWRKNRAVFLCKNTLYPFDPSGLHCK